MIRRIFFAIIVRQDTMSYYFDFAIDKNMVDDPIGQFFPLKSSKSACWAIGRDFGYHPSILPRMI